MSQRLQTDTRKPIVYAQSIVNSQGSGNKRKRQSLPLIPKQAAITNWLQEMPNTPPRAATPIIDSSPVIISGASTGSGSGSGVSSSSGAGGGSTQSHVRPIEPATILQWGPQAQDGEMPPPTAVQVARQLWQFHGCTQEQHQAKEEEHA